MLKHKFYTALQNNCDHEEGEPPADAYDYYCMTSLRQTANKLLEELKIEAYYKFLEEFYQLVHYPSSKDPRVLAEVDGVLKKNINILHAIMKCGFGGI